MVLLQGQQVTPHRSMLRTLMSSSSSPHGFSGSVVQVQPVTPQRPTYRTSVLSSTLANCFFFKMYLSFIFFFSIVHFKII